MARSRASDRIPTRNRGISYRVLRDGSRSYSIYWRGSYVKVEGGEQDAVIKQAELRQADARGERTVSLRPAASATFGALVAEWMAGKRLRPYTKRAYQDALDRILIPRFGSTEVAAITRAQVRQLIRDLEGRGLASSTIESYLLPLSGTLSEAVGQGLIAANPVKQLTRDDRAERTERVQDHVWNAAEINALIEAAEAQARRPGARADYAPLIRTALCTGLRLGELLGLRWEDVDLAGGMLTRIPRQRIYADGS
jgi:integrase